MIKEKKDSNVDGDGKFLLLGEGEGSKIIFNFTGR